MEQDSHIPKAVLDSMPGIVFWKSADLRYLGANKKFIELIELIGLKNSAPLIGKKDHEMPWSKQYKEYFSEYDQDIIDLGKPVFAIQKNILLPNKKKVTIITDKYPLYDKENKRIGVLGIATTIYDQQVNSQTYLENIIEILPYFIFWKNINSVYLGCNKQFANLVGKKHPKEVIGKTDFDLEWGAGEPELFRLGDQKTMLGNSTINAEETLIRPDGSEVTMLVNKVPLLDKSGHCIGVLGTSTDITQLKNTQFKLKEAEERLAGIRTLSANIAHELRTPLSAIQFSVSGTKDYLPILVEAYTMAKEHHLKVQPIQTTHLQIISNIFDSIESEIRYSETIINMILMNVKQNGVSKADFKLYSMKDCIDEAMRRYPFKQGEAELIERPNSSDFLFKGDKTLMVHILFNLLKNALYFIESVKKGKIKIWCESNQNDNILYFKDTAKGIPQDVLPKIFDRFYSTTHHGTGLGLAYCKMVMTSFDGAISCKSEYGKFTQFEMKFPNNENMNPNS